MAQQIPTCSPLTDEHCTILDQVALGCQLQDELLDKCKAAGMPGLDPYIRDNNRRKQIVAGLKSAFFPDRP